MKRILGFLAAFVTMSAPLLVAQNVPRVDAFGGFSMLVPDVANDKRMTLNGWQAGVAANVTNFIGVVGDFGGHYEDGLNVHQYLAGIRFNARKDKATAFVHGLLGGIRASGGGGSENGYLMGYGGGLDLNVGERIAVRL